MNEMVPFLDFSASYSPKYYLMLLKLWPQVVNKTNTVFEKSFKIFNFGPNGMHLKFTVLINFGAKVTARKPKLLLKTKVAGKTAPLGIINDVIRGPREITEFF